MRSAITDEMDGLRCIWTSLAARRAAVEDFGLLPRLVDVRLGCDLDRVHLLPGQFEQCGKHRSIVTAALLQGGGCTALRMWAISLRKPRACGVGWVDTNSSTAGR